MKNLITEFSILARNGLFKTEIEGVSDASFEHLQLQYESAMNENDLEKACKLAKKAVLLFGTESIDWYFTTQAKLISKYQHEGELTEQHLINVFAIISFIKQHLELPSDDAQKIMDIEEQFSSLAGDTALLQRVQQEGELAGNHLNALVKR